MEIQEAWDNLVKIGSSDALVIQETARVKLISACVPMRKKTVRKATCQLPPYFMANHEDDLYGECDLAVDEVAVRLIKKDPKLTGENPAGYLKTKMLWACYDFISDELKGGIKASEPYCNLEDEFPGFESFDLAVHDQERDETGFDLIDSRDEIDAAFKAPFERMILDCIEDACELNYSAIASALGCSPKTVAKTVDACLVRIRADGVDYSLSV